MTSLGGGTCLPPTIPSKTLGMTTRLATTLGMNGNSIGGGIGSNPSRSSSNLNVTTGVAPTPSLGMNLNSSEPLQRSSTSDDTSHNFVEAPRGSTNSHASDVRNSAPKKTRGFSRAIKTSTIMLTSGKRIEIHLDEDLGVPMGQVRNISSLLSHECGYQVRTHAPLLQAHWDDIDEDTKQKLIDGVTTNFDIDTKEPKWYKYICDNMRNRYNDYKHKLAKYYKSCESDEVARENPPIKLLRERDLSEWEWLCDHFLSEKYQKRSETNSINRSKKRWEHCGGSRPFSLYYHDHIEGGSQFPDIDTWGTTHMSKKKKNWVNDAAKDAHDEMIKKKNEYLENITDEGTSMDEIVVAPNVGTEIMEDVIGRGCGRTIRGAGKGRVRETSSSSSSNTSSIALTKEVQELQAQLQMERKARMKVVAEHEEQKAQWGFVMQQLQVLVPGFSIPEPAPLSHEDFEDGDESDHSQSFT
ncbi:uncharacterized protein M6B38_388800 [Iris pallida]|uniref:Transposase, Ptta/En/Spm, plant n=1 Tax=Iris pallida TaxID=29817 RepID=A0AAX6G2C6_IRIPA|nr:uncharacterized protein M6B38_388800 [Iris pallida]